MIITAGVRIGTHKPVCDDIAIINDVVINDEHHQSETDNLRVVAITDGVGGNAGGKEASMFVAEALSKMSFAEDEGGIRTQLEQLNRDLLEYAATIPDKRHMATTLTAMALSMRKEAEEMQRDIFNRCLSTKVI